MIGFFHPLTLVVSLLIILGCSTPVGGEYRQNSRQIPWVMLEKGLYYVELDAPFKSKVNDNKISIVRINPAFFSFELLMASQSDSVPRTVEEWSVENKLAAVINAGMYNTRNFITATGYMKNYDHINNNHVRKDYKSVAAFNRKNNKVPEFVIIDMEHDDWEWYQKQYFSFSQCIRMIDCNQEQVEWKPRRPISSSMVVLANDVYGNILFVFTRSPYTANQMSKMLLGFPLHVYSAMYLEGGPESSLYVNAGDTIIEKVGSWVSRGWARDDNDHFWRLPNVIGVKRKF
jgi:hypothetical protein